VASYSSGTREKMTLRHKLTLHLKNSRLRFFIVEKRLGENETELLSKDRGRAVDTGFT
jgi:hypothetical protein